MEFYISIRFKNDTTLTEQISKEVYDILGTGMAEGKPIKDFYFQNIKNNSIDVNYKFVAYIRIYSYGK